MNWLEARERLLVNASRARSVVVEPEQEWVEEWSEEWFTVFGLRLFRLNVLTDVIRPTGRYRLRLKYDHGLDVWDAATGTEQEMLELYVWLKTHVLGDRLRSLPVMPS